MSRGATVNTQYPRGELHTLTRVRNHVNDTMILLLPRAERQKLLSRGDGIFVKLMEVLGSDELQNFQSR